MNSIIYIHNNNPRSPSLILGALLASMLLTLPTAASAHGREGRDREKMSSLLQSLFEMKERRGETQTPEWNPTRVGYSAGAWSDPSVAPLSHESPPSQPPYHLGLLRVSGAAAAKLPVPVIRSSGGGGGAGRKRDTAPRLAMSHGGAEEAAPAALDDESPAANVKHDFVRDLRRQFELRQQRAHADA